MLVFCKSNNNNVCSLLPNYYFSNIRLTASLGSQIIFADVVAYQICEEGQVQVKDRPDFGIWNNYNQRYDI